MKMQALPWGRIFLVLILSVIPLAIWILYRWPPAEHEPFYALQLPLAALAGLVMSFFLIHLTSPWVRNISLALVIGSLCWIFLPWFVPRLTAIVPRYPWEGGLFLLAACSLVASSLVPRKASETSFRLALSLYIGLSLGLFILFWVYGSTIHRLLVERTLPLVRMLIAAALAILTSFLAFSRFKDSFGHDGLIAGCSVLFYLAIHLSLSEAADPFLSLVLLLLALVLVAAAFIQWLLALNHRANYDPLLRIYNRSYADDLLTQPSRRYPYSLVLFDLDHFKAVNDTHGHQAGDAVLFETAQRIRREVLPAGVLCRYGGEEILAFFPGLDAAKAVEVAERCRKQVKEHEVKYGSTQIRVSVSGGAAERAADNEPLEAVLVRADAALYKAKENGRNRIVGSRGTDAAKPKLARAKKQAPAAASKPGPGASAAKPAETGKKQQAKKNKAGKKKTQGRQSKPALTGRDWHRRQTQGS